MLHGVNSTVKYLIPANTSKYQQMPVNASCAVISLTCQKIIEPNDGLGNSNPMT